MTITGSGWTSLRVGLAAASPLIAGLGNIFYGLASPKRIGLIPGVLLLALAWWVLKRSLVALIIAILWLIILAASLLALGGLAGLLVVTPFLAATAQALPLLWKPSARRPSGAPNS